MNNFKIIMEEYGISEEIAKLYEKATVLVQRRIKCQQDIVEYNQIKVLKAFRDQRISNLHFNSTNGYGYDDIGREALDKLYAQIFGAEDAMVRHNIISGTHALSLCLFAVLRPNDTLISVTGNPLIHWKRL